MQNLQIKHPKIILLGDMSKYITIDDIIGVGKTAILQTLVNGQFPQKVVSTMGACFQRYTCRAQNGREVSMDIWDTAGQEKYRSLLTMYYKNSDVIIMVFDLSCKQTFQTVDFWAKQIQENCETKPSIILVGNKYDLRKQIKLLPEQNIKNYVRNKKWVYFNASALQNYNVKQIFQKAATLALQNQTRQSLQRQKKQNIRVSRRKTRDRDNQSSCC